MQTWPRPYIPALTPIIDSPEAFGEQYAESASNDAAGVLPVLQLFNSVEQAVTPVVLPEDPTDPVGLYVCGITPYDSTHLGHAATYVTFDLIHRYLLASGRDVHFVQNITDVDDPLFERAARDGVDWQELGKGQIDLFRSDMAQLDVIPPRDYVGIMESIDEIIAMVSDLLACGAAYQLTDDPYPDIYASRAATKDFGYVSGYDEATMQQLFAERGGDPERAGKRDPLDALLWRAARPGEPQWDAPFGAGRPGWHVECSAIAKQRLGMPFAIQGGGSDLRFPHHEYSAAHAESIHGGNTHMAHHYVHTGMIGLDGTKMSKSLGNLVFVSQLTAAGHEPSAIRLGLYSRHYREDRDWSDAVLEEATTRLGLWRAALGVLRDDLFAEDTIAEIAHANRALHDTVVGAIAQDLNTPEALEAVDAWAHAMLQLGESADTATAANIRVAEAAEQAQQATHLLEALFGLQLGQTSEQLAEQWGSHVVELAEGAYLRPEEREFWDPPYSVDVAHETAGIVRGFLASAQAVLGDLDPIAEPNAETRADLLFGAIAPGLRKLTALSDETFDALLDVEEVDELQDVLIALAREHYADVWSVLEQVRDIIEQ